MRNKRILIGILAVLLVAFGVVTTFHVETQTAKAYHKQICILGACFSIYAQIPPSLPQFDLYINGRQYVSEPASRRWSICR